MGSQFAAGKIAIAICDRCGFQFKLKQLKGETVKTTPVNNKVCPQCWDPDHPQLQLGMYPVDDPQALRDARPDTSYFVSGLTSTGSQGGGSRVIQWGWNPVGGASAEASPLTPNTLRLTIEVGQVTVTTT